MTRHRVWSLVLTVLVATGVACPSTSHAQAADISLSGDAHISSDTPKTPFAETFLAINPRDAMNLVATSIVGSSGKHLCYVYASRDGGRTWQRAKTTTADNPIFTEYGGDPVVYFDSKGTAFFGELLHGFVVSRSTDGGFTWEAPVMVPGNYDREYMAIDNSGGRFNGRIYAAGQGHFNETNGKGSGALDIAISTDNGRSFSLSTTLAHRCAAGEGGGLVSVALVDLLVTLDGKLIVPFHGGDCSRSGLSQLWTTVSQDGGRTFFPAQAGPSYATGEIGFRYMKSHSTPRAAIDSSSGPYRGWIYVTYIDFDGKKYVVKITHSGDLGKTWSEPILVNDDTNPGDPANAALAVNKDGVVGVVFNGRDDIKSSCFRLYFAASLDGGQTFLPNVRASDQPTCPAASGNWTLRGSSYFVPDPGGKSHAVIWMSSLADRFPNGGDTQGLAAGPDGVFHSAWINGESGVMQLWFKSFTVHGIPVVKSPSRQDLSAELTLEASEPILEYATHTISIKVRLLNSSAVVVSVPLTVSLDAVKSYLQDLRAINADNGLHGKGASWNFTVGAKKSLGPQQQSEERMLRWGFSGDLPEQPWGGLFDAQFVILGKPLSQ